MLETLSVRLDDLHDRLWAEARRSVVLVLQGMDASGKDGTIRRVLTGLNPQGCAVVNFKAPTTRRPRPRLPLAHPRRARRRGGSSGCWNRSHYEDVVDGPDASAPSTTTARRGGATATSGSSSGCSRRGHLGGQGLPPHLEGRAAGPAAGAHRRSGEELEVPPRRPRRPRRSGTSTRSATSGRSPRRRPAGRRGTWCRPTTSGSATSPWPRCWSMCSRGLDPQIPDPEPGLEGLVVRVVRPEFRSRVVTAGAPSARMVVLDGRRVA